MFRSRSAQDKKHQPAPSGRSLALGAARLILVPTAVVFVLAQVTALADQSLVLRRVDLFFLGLLVNQLALMVFAARMRMVLRLVGVTVGWRSALRIHLQSMFYFIAVPMTVGLEVARFVKIRKIQPSASGAQLSAALLLDRLIGAGSAGLVALACLPFVATNLSLRLPMWLWPVIGGVALVAVSAAALSSGVRKMMLVAWRITERRFVAIGALCLVSTSMHIIFAFGVQLLANSFALPIGFLDTLLAVSGGLLLVAIPVSFAGLGPAEAGAASLLMATGYPVAVAVSAGAIPYFARLVGAGEGAFLEMLEGGIATLNSTRRLLAQR
jgi:uncharacterized membrane protein YbhN (UPF0104 family)